MHDVDNGTKAKKCVYYTAQRADKSQMPNAIQCSSSIYKNTLQCTSNPQHKDPQPRNQWLVPAHCEFLKTRGSHFCFAAEVRDSQKFFKILRIEIQNYHILMTMGMY
jgi:hypothetical protein